MTNNQRDKRNSLIQIFEDGYYNQLGSFMKLLCDTIVKADIDNTKKLYRAYPELVEGYILWNKGITWTEFIARN